LKTLFISPILEIDQVPLGPNTNIQIEEADEATVDLRVYRETRQIYVDPYKNQQIIDMEREKMNGDFSELLFNSYIAILSNHYENKRKFWIAKVEKILTREQNVPKMIQVLWHAVKKRQNAWRGKYLPEIIGYEKHGGKRKKSIQRPI
jgi:hypothetical protein